MAKKKSGDHYRAVPMPYRGVAEHSAFSEQPQGTAPYAENVRAFDPRTGRRRIASRGGLEKVANETVSGDSPIQDLALLTVPTSATLGTGAALAISASSAGNISMYDSLGNEIFTTASNASFERRITFAFDESGNGYAVGEKNGSPTGIVLTRINANGTQAWNTTLQTMNTTVTSSDLNGIIARDGIVYVHRCGFSTNLGNYRNLWRVYATNGTIVDSGPWLTQNSGLSNSTAPIAEGKSLAIAGGLLGVLGANSGGEAILQTVNVSTGAIVANITIHSASNGRASVTADDAGNFYTSVHVNSASNKCGKLLSNGTFAWSSSNSSGTPARIDYNRANGTLGGVSTAFNAFGSSRAVAVVYPQNGTVIASGNGGISSGVGWETIAADGSGGWRVSRANTTLGVASLNSTLSSQWTKAVSTGFSAVAATAGAVNFANLMQSTRSMRGLAVSSGTVKRFDNGTLASVTNGNLALAAGAISVFSTSNNLYQYYVDGTKYVRYNPFTNAVETWTATSGTMPTDSAGECCRLIVTWRGRVVLSGLRNDPQNWFMSAVDNPLNWNYAPSPTLATQAVAGNNSDAGLVGDLINCMIPYSDDLLIFGGDRSIWVMRGDPMAGGQIDRVSDITGIAWGRPWCKDPVGNVYFLGSRGGIFKMAGGAGLPERMSGPVEERLATLDLSKTICRMVWDDRQMGFHIFLTQTDGSAQQHLWYDARNEAWWPDLLQTDHDPYSVLVFDGDLPNDRRVLLGGRDGYIRAINSSLGQDDGFAVNSTLRLGPIMGSLDEIAHLKEMKAKLGEDSGNVTWGVRTGRTAEAALDSASRLNGTWSAGDNLWDLVYLAGDSIYLNLVSNTTWAMEGLTLRVETIGGTRRRIGE